MNNIKKIKNTIFDPAVEFYTRNTFTGLAVFWLGNYNFTFRLF